MWPDVDFEKGTIFVHQVVSLKNYVPYIKPTTKSVAGTRTIHMHPLVKSIFQELKATAKENETVFCNDSGGIWAPNCFYVLYKKYIESYNMWQSEQVKNIGMKASPVTYHSPHATRHTFASDLNRAGVDPKTMAALLGHSHTDISLDVYTHTDDTAKAEAIDKL